MNLKPWKAEDPPVAWVLWSLAILTAAAVALVPALGVDDRAGYREAILKCAGGVLLLLGSYFAARTLNQARADQRSNRALKAIEFLGHSDPDVKRVGRALLDSMLVEPKDPPRTEVQKMIEKVAAAVPSRDRRPD